VKTDDPHLYVKEHIIKGDRGDGIPNFLSADNVFALGERQKVINKKKLDEWLKLKPEEFCVNENMLRNFKRNQMLVDLDYIPDSISAQIVEAYENVKPGNKQKMFNYFVEKKLVNLMEVIQEF
jgi:hypothetical protein